MPGAGREALISIEIEKSKLNREKSLMVLDKALLLYFSFLFIGVIGFINGYLTAGFLNQLVVMGIVVLLIGIVPYVITMHREEQKLDQLLGHYKGRNGARRGGTSARR